MANNQQVSFGRQAGFTLLELLAVIAVLGLLAAIAYPALSTARDNASFAKSGAGLRSAGAALGLYLAENNMIFPPYRANADGTGAYWRQSLAEYLVVMGAGDGTENARRARTKLYHQTFWSEGYLRAAGMPGPTDSGNGFGSHSINGFFAREIGSGPNPRGSVRVRRHDPSIIGREEPYMVDGALGSDGGGTNGNTRFNSTEAGKVGGGWADYYGGKVNALYIDGSVRVLGPQDAERLATKVRDLGTLE